MTLIKQEDYNKQNQEGTIYYYCRLRIFVDYNQLTVGGAS